MDRRHLSTELGGDDILDGLALQHLDLGLDDAVLGGRVDPAAAGLEQVLGRLLLHEQRRRGLVDGRLQLAGPEGGPGRQDDRGDHEPLTAPHQAHEPAVVQLVGTRLDLVHVHSTLRRLDLGHAIVACRDGSAEAAPVDGDGSASQGAWQQVRGA